ncbi:MAG: hypothetical protein LM514_04385 [Streptococcus sp.]|nr:hypothetical protein [Streptococcus sp.]
MTNIEKLRLFIANAPTARLGLATPVVGIQGEDFVICHICMDRIHRRGCSIPKPSELLWDDQGIMMVDCDLKEFH